MNEKIVCPKCGRKNPQGTWHCDCGYDFDQANNDSSVERQRTLSNSSSSLRGEGAISVLRFFAWLDLAIGIIGAIAIWFIFGTTRTIGFYSSTAEANPLAIGIGIAILFQGMFLCAFFLVIASIAESLIIIRKDKML